MGPIGTAALRDAWDMGLYQHPVARAITLLQTDDPQASAGELAALTVGERDRRLLAMRERLVGRSFESAAGCPNCGERIELGFDADDVRANAGPPPVTSVSFEFEGYKVVATLPNSLDLLDAAQARTVRDRSTRLFRRCLQSVTREGVDVTFESLPAELAEITGSHLAEADAMNEVRISLACPQCGHEWSEQFDIAAYLWHEVDERARRHLHDVHILASHYGWSESEILGLSEARRQFYLGMVMAQ